MYIHKYMKHEECVKKLVNLQWDGNISLSCFFTFMVTESTMRFSNCHNFLGDIIINFLSISSEKEIMH